MKLTVIVPAYNEEAYLASTLESIQSAAAYLRTRSDASVDIIVVDNNSDDGTAAVASGMGVTVVLEGEQGIARARNTGARVADGDVLGVRRRRRDRAARVVVRDPRGDERSGMRRRRGGCGLQAEAAFDEALPDDVMATPGTPDEDGTGRDAVLPTGCLRGSRRL